MNNVVRGTKKKNGAQRDADLGGHEGSFWNEGSGVCNLNLGIWVESWMAGTEGWPDKATDYQCTRICCIEPCY